MLSSPDNFADIARAIQLALAPVFLLTGIAGLLNVMAGRLSRIFDRGRALSEGRGAPVPSGHNEFEHEQECLERRRHFTSVAITASTISALLICMDVAAIFLDVLLDAPLRWPIGALFIAAVLTLIVGLTFFLREVHLAMQITITTPKAKDAKQRKAA